MTEFTNGVLGGASMESERFAVDGMSCDHCIARVQKALDGVNGVERASIDLTGAEVTWNPERTDREGIVVAIRSAGYSAA